MLKNILNLEGAQKLTQNEQKEINGGFVAPTSIDCECGIKAESVRECEKRCLGIV